MENGYKPDRGTCGERPHMGSDNTVTQHCAVFLHLRGATPYGERLFVLFAFWYAKHLRGATPYGERRTNSSSVTRLFSLRGATPYGERQQKCINYIFAIQNLCAFYIKHFN